MPFSFDLPYLYEKHDMLSPLYLPLLDEPPYTSKLFEVLPLYVPGNIPFSFVFLSRHPL